MSWRQRCGLLALLATTLAACSGSSGTPTCNFDDAAQMCGSAPRQSNCTPQSAWPKFHHDVQNTGTVVNAAVATNPGQRRWVFPSGGQGKGAFTASPVINATGTIIYIGSTDGTFYALNAADGTQNPAFNFAAAQAITATALVATRDGMDAVFFTANDGNVYGLNSTAAGLQTNWPSVPGGVLSAPTLGLDGAVYVGTADGLFVGVCPNGIERFILSVASTLSSPAEAPDGTLYFGGDDGQLRAVQFNGTLSWTFAAAGPIVASPVYDTETSSVYVADRSGRVFKVDTNGRPVQGFSSAGVGPISSSPALAANRLYFGSDDGNIYAIDKTTGANPFGRPFWTTGDAVISSPAVITSPTQPSTAIVVVGSNDGTVYFLQDNGDSVTQLMPPFAIGAPVRSSPAIGSDGTIYIGADDGRVYAIGSPLMQPTPSPAAP